jgi:hypothetical protein
MTLLTRIVRMYHGPLRIPAHAAENAAWDAFFTGRPMNWLNGEREMHRSDIARQREKIAKARHTEGATGRHASDWALLLIAVVLVASCQAGVFAS